MIIFGEKLLVIGWFTASYIKSDGKLWLWRKLHLDSAAWVEMRVDFLRLTNDGASILRRDAPSLAVPLPPPRLSPSLRCLNGPSWEAVESANLVWSGSVNFSVTSTTYTGVQNNSFQTFQIQRKNIEPDISFRLMKYATLSFLLHLCNMQTPH